MGVAGENDLPLVGSGQMDVEHLDRCELFQDRSRRQPRRRTLEPGFGGHLQAVRQERHKDVGVDPASALVIDGTRSQVALEFFEGLFDLGELHVELPKLGRIGLGQVSPDISRWEKKSSEVLRVTRLIGGA